MLASSIFLVRVQRLHLLKDLRQLLGYFDETRRTLYQKLLVHFCAFDSRGLQVLV